MPLFEPADHVTTADAFPATADTPVGAPGTTLGVTAKEGADEAEFPALFTATTVKVRAVPFARPLNVAVRTLPTVWAEPEEGVTIYPVMAAPPFDEGADHVTTADSLPGVADTSLGAVAVVAGVTEAEAEDAAEFPTLLIALTVNVRAVPLVRSLNVAVRTLPTVCAEPEEGVTMYPVISAPPFESGADQFTTAEAFPAVADTPVGAPATVAGVTGDDAEEEGEFPKLFFATTVKVTGVPFVRPVIVTFETFPTVTAEPDEGVTM